MPTVTPGASSLALTPGTPLVQTPIRVTPAGRTIYLTTGGPPVVQTSTTVFTLGGYFDPIPGAVDVNYQLQGKITANYPVINVAWPNFGLDAAAIALGPQLYPTDQLTSINTGRDNLNTALLGQSGRKVVLAHSAGAVVASKWLHDLGNASTIPVADLMFVFIGNSVRRYGGVYYHDEYGVPVNTKYQVLDIARQYDGFADWPTETDNQNYLLAEMNAMTGVTWVHPWYQQVDPFDTTMPRFQEGNITYVLAPTRPWWQPDYAIPFIEQAYNRPETTAASAPIVVAPPTNSSPLVKRYPQGPITHHGALMLLDGNVPMMCYRSFDDTIKFDIAGPLAIPDRTMPECVRLKGLKGLVPPWQNISQKGATDDGEHYVTSLYDPIDVDLTVEFKGRDVANKRQLVRDWIAAWDAKKPGELSFTDTSYPSAGRWWAKVRWAKNPADPESLTFVSKYTWPAKAYDGFWRSYDSVDEFRLTQQNVTVSDDFNYSSNTDWGPSWDLGYYGGGVSHTGTLDGQAVWYTAGTQMRGVVARRHGFTTTTDYQVVEMVLGSMPQTFFVDQAFDDVWCRQANTGNPGDVGVRLRVGVGTAELAYFIGGVKTVLRQQDLWIPPQPGERWSVVAGTPANPATATPDAPRLFTVLRNGTPVMSVQEKGTGSPLGPTYRSVGAGMEAGAGWFNQAIPGSLLKWNAGDNVSTTQEGWLTRYNAGDQDMWDRFTIYGPALLVEMGNGPGETDMVGFGPVLDGQAMQIRTQPGKRGVVDLSSQPATVAQNSLFAAALADYYDHAMASNVTPLEQAIANGNGVVTVQGNPYSLLKGRFTKPVPPKPAAGQPPKYQVKVRVTGGNAHTAVAVAGTPLRRYPH